MFILPLFWTTNNTHLYREARWILSEFSQSAAAGVCISQRLEDNSQGLRMSKAYD